MTTPCIGFGWPKAPLVLARELGDIVQTSREMKDQPANLPGLYADLYNHEPDHWAFWLPDGRMDSPRIYKPRYRRGKVYHVGVPHWRSIDKQWCWDEFTKRFQGAGGWVYHASLDELSQYNIQWRRCSSYCLPSRAATQWLLCLSAEPQRLLCRTEQDAIEELVERLKPPHSDMWVNYGLRLRPCATALASYHTMLAAVLKRPVAELLAANEWFWRCRFEVVEEPKEC